MTEAPALEAALADAKGTARTFDAFDETWTVVRKPSLLLLAELARTESGDPAALGVVADFFEVTLGKAAYQRFRKAFFTSDEAEDENLLGELLGKVIEVSVGRPTE